MTCPGRRISPSSSSSEDSGASGRGRREPSVTCNGNPIQGLITSLAGSGTFDSKEEKVKGIVEESEKQGENGWSCKLESITPHSNLNSTLPISLTGYLGSWKKNRNLCGNFSVSGDTMEGIVQCLVFLKAFSVRLYILNLLLSTKIGESRMSPNLEV